MGGGTDNDDAIKWMFQKAGGGDVVVLRSAGTDGYNTYMYSELGVPVNSVETIIIDTRGKASIAAIATKIRNAEALFIAGGDQATYCFLLERYPSRRRNQLFNQYQKSTSWWN